MPLDVVDTRPYFRPVAAETLALLRGLPLDEWNRPTLAPAWRVRDVVAHMVDTALRRVSLHRDGAAPVEPPHPIRGEADLVRFVNSLNASWVAVSQRWSPRVLTELYDMASTRLADFAEQLPLDGPALFPVSWAGEMASAGWLDLAREFTEVWHHGAQVRDAVSAAPFPDPRWLHAVLATALHALPHAFRNVAAREGQTLALAVSGAAGGAWALRYTGAGWDLGENGGEGADARAVLSDDTAWRLFFNALSPEQAATRITLHGEPRLTTPLLRARSVIV